MKSSTYDTKKATEYSFQIQQTHFVSICHIFEQTTIENIVTKGEITHNNELLIPHALSRHSLSMHAV